MEDTDSMAIVASERGGLVPCPGGPYRTKDGREAIRALSWEQVHEIVSSSIASTPTIARPCPGFDPQDRSRQLRSQDQRAAATLVPGDFRQALRALLARSQRRAGAAAERVNNGEDGENRWSEHGLGHLLNPSDPESDDRSWIAQAWLGIVRRSLGLPTKPLPFESASPLGGPP